MRCNMALTKGCTNGIGYVCFLWTEMFVTPLLVIFGPQMPFADDYTNALFPSLENVKSRQGMAVEKHANIPTTSQQDAMDEFVAAMDLSEARYAKLEILPTL